MSLSVVIVGVIHEPPAFCNSDMYTAILDEEMALKAFLMKRKNCIRKRRFLTGIALAYEMNGNSRKWDLS